MLIDARPLRCMTSSICAMMFWTMAANTGSLTQVGVGVRLSVPHLLANAAAENVVSPRQPRHQQHWAVSRDHVELLEHCPGSLRRDLDAEHIPGNRRDGDPDRTNAFT
jgi:hypothetical protein